MTAVAVVLATVAALERGVLVVLDAAFVAGFTGTTETALAGFLRAAAAGFVVVAVLVSKTAGAAAGLTVFGILLFARIKALTSG